MKRGGVKLGVLWGVISPIIVSVVVSYLRFGRKGIPSLMLKILTLPQTSYYLLFVPESAPGGSFYYSPILVFPASIIIGAFLGFLGEKIYTKFKLAWLSCSMY